MISNADGTEDKVFEMNDDFEFSVVMNHLVLLGYKNTISEFEYEFPDWKYLMQYAGCHQDAKTLANFIEKRFDVVQLINTGEMDKIYPIIEETWPGLLEGSSQLRFYLRIGEYLQLIRDGRYDDAKRIVRDHIEDFVSTEQNRRVLFRNVLLLLFFQPVHECPYAYFLESKWKQYLADIINLKLFKQTVKTRFKPSTNPPFTSIRMYDTNLEDGVHFGTKLNIMRQLNNCDGIQICERVHDLCMKNENDFDQIPTNSEEKCSYQKKQTHYKWNDDDDDDYDDDFDDEYENGYDLGKPKSTTQMPN